MIPGQRGIPEHIVELEAVRATEYPLSAAVQPGGDALKIPVSLLALS